MIVWAHPKLTMAWIKMSMLRNAGGNDLIKVLQKTSLEGIVYTWEFQ